MDENNISKSTYQWIFFLFILLILIIFLSTRLLGMRKVEQQKHLVEPTLGKEAVAPEAEEPKEVVKEIPESTAKDEPKPEGKD